MEQLIKKLKDLEIKISNIRDEQTSSEFETELSDVHRAITVLLTVYGRE